MQGAFRGGALPISSESFTRERGLVCDDTVNAEIEEALHVAGRIDGPGIDLLASTMSPADKTLVESGLLHAQKVDVQSRRLTGIKREQVTDGHIRGKSMHFSERFVFQALDHDLVEHSLPAHCFDDFLREPRLMAAIVFQFNVQLDPAFRLRQESI